MHQYYLTSISQPPLVQDRAIHTEQLRLGNGLNRGASNFPTGNEPSINHTIGSRHHLLSKWVIENPTDPVLSLGNLQDFSRDFSHPTSIHHNFMSLFGRKILIFSQLLKHHGKLAPWKTAIWSWEVCTMTFSLYFPGFSPSNILHTHFRKEMKNILGGILIKSYCWWVPKSQSQPPFGCLKPCR